MDSVEGFYKGLHIQIATEAHISAIGEFLHKYFFSDEPVNRCLGYCEDYGEETRRWVAALLHQDNKHTLVAIDKTNGRIAGVRVSCLVTRIQGHPPHAATQNTIRKTVRGMIQELERRCWGNRSVFDVYEVDEYLEFKFLGVHPDYRQMSLGTELMARGIQLARVLRIPLVTNLLSSAYSTKIAQRLGMEVVGEIKYGDYEVEGRRPFADIAETHGSVKLMIIRL